MEGDRDAVYVRITDKGDGNCNEPESASIGTPSGGYLTTANKHKRRNFICRKCFEGVVIGVVIAAVWVLLALPIALYHLPQVRHVGVT